MQSFFALYTSAGDAWLTGLGCGGDSGLNATEFLNTWLVESVLGHLVEAAAVQASQPFPLGE